ncbi:DUF5615 family PIN-like protein [Cellulomonas pakistanensis]|uniref:DUF5615 domain-containing protein n=1 Tax=Cellulomonas pakistanensis TaxID=992287 RepID=A0A919U7E6_9CELL|nr:DUF5615 family PIN-like protein [Cellulomonas pakistanensis]GIG36912.1 hypothetical protein Cpa01nite_22930 [Cellulomonas pakistanensis]
MKFLVDAQLPPRLVRALVRHGHDAVHTRDLPHGNRTPDAEVAARADAENRVVVTNDADFQITHQLHGRQRRLLVVATGNITDDDLLLVVERSLSTVLAAFDAADRVELRAAEIVAWPRRAVSTDQV